MRTTTGELQDARAISELDTRRVKDGFRIIRDVRSTELVKITDQILRQVIALEGSMGFRKKLQAFRPGLAIVGSNAIHNTLEGQARLAKWEEMQDRNLRSELITMSSVATQHGLPRFFPALVSSFFYEKPTDSVTTKQYIWCRFGSAAGIDPAQQQRRDRSLLTVEGLGVTGLDQGYPPEEDGVLEYAHFSSDVPESKVRGLVDSLNDRVTQAHTAVRISPLKYVIFHKAIEG